SFRATVRPHPALHFAEIYAGWQRFRADFSGKLDLEFFAMPGLNTAPAQVNAILALAERLHPDTLTVNSAERPPAEACVKPLPPAELEHLRALFSTIAAEQHATAPAAPEPYSEEALIALARRHPLTPAQFARYFAVSEEAIVAALKRHHDPFADRALSTPPLS
ncbi:MAG: hypothetical protein ACI4YA_03790, partial [Candidatus Spyradenecus sp.]